eukprot:3796256-Amphidinium_carterae.2
MFAIKLRLETGWTNRYGVKFYGCIIAAKPPISDYPTDISVPFTEYADMVMSMAPASQQVIVNGLDWLMPTTYLMLGLKPTSSFALPNATTH